ncbi:MAG: hypothetical protein HZA89_00290 [Verrucomicrobia bacterium]|nr:hypothetical protein [Verrucomicrobiota bacterium]
MGALHTYKADFGAYPAGDTRTIWRSLRGENPKKMVFINFDSKSFSSEGDLLDPWGTPYRLEFSEGKPHVRSAGPNQRFDDPRDKNSDDIFQ